MHKVITSTHYNRPQSSRQMVEYLSRCKGVEDYLLICYCEPDFPEVVEALREYPFPIEIHINKELLGCWENKKAAIKRGFEISDYVIHLEDDVVLAHDALQFFEYCQIYRFDKRCLSCSAHSLVNGEGHGDIRTLCRGGYSPHAFSFFKDRYEMLINDGWNGSDRFIKDKYRWYQNIYPFISRAKHIGDVYGVGSHPSMRKAMKSRNLEPFAYAGLVYADKDSFISDRDNYVQALQTRLSEETNPITQAAMQHQINVAMTTGFERQLVINTKQEEWIKLNDSNFKSKALSEYEKYKINTWSDDYEQTGVFKE